MLFDATLGGYNREMEELRRRARLLREIRRFLDNRGYLEVETPQVCATPIPEAHLHLFSTTFLHPREAQQQLYLLPSPEYYLKKLLAAGSGSIYEITHSFRNAESVGPHHNPEFTMLEYYTVDAHSGDSLEVTRDLLSALGETAEPLVMTMAQCWQRWTGIDLENVLEAPALVEAIIARGLSASSRHELARCSWEDLFQRTFLSHVEPNLPRDRPVFVTHYPAAIATLARGVPGTPWADRWELYLDGVEVANCYGEETDPQVILRFMEEQHGLLQRRGDPEPPSPPSPPPPMDPLFLQPPNVLPRCSGVALGVDRLCMHFLGEQTINRVISFPFFR